MSKHDDEKKRRATLESAEVKCREIARRLKGVMPEGWGFMLVLSSFGEDGFFTYLSDLQRADAIKLLREAVSKIERNERSV